MRVGGAPRRALVCPCERLRCPPLTDPTCLTSVSWEGCFAAVHCLTPTLHSWVPVHASSSVAWDREHTQRRACELYIQRTGAREPGNLGSWDPWPVCLLFPMPLGRHRGRQQCFEGKRAPDGFSGSGLGTWNVVICSGCTRGASLCGTHGKHK